MKTGRLLCGLIAAAVMQGSAAADFSFSFAWGDIPLCTSGSPNRVDNPRFVLSNVPAGTKFIEFKMSDRDVPDYDHGGGTVAYSGQAVIEPGAFQYESPCPPDGRHTYEWSAAAKESDGFFGSAIAEARARKKYP